MEQQNRVCAIVVTYNRSELLRDCLRAIVNQTRPVERILVIDNASTDATPEVMSTEFDQTIFPQIEHVRLPRNIGGAGGFHEGMKRAVEEGCEWLWLMDDDTIPQRDALVNLFVARDRFPEGCHPDVLASKVIWKDGSIHWMNQPWVKVGGSEEAFAAAERGVFPLRAGTFVSLLLHRRFVEEFGLPLASYFLHADDTEYTARILRNNFGVAVPTSVVLHSTATNFGPLEGPPSKFFYYVRNTLWMCSRSRALSFSERIKYLARFFVSLVKYVRRQPQKIAALRSILAGLLRSIVTAPR